MNNTDSLIGLIILFSLGSYVMGLVHGYCAGYDHCTNVNNKKGKL